MDGKERRAVRRRFATCRLLPVLAGSLRDRHIERELSVAGEGVFLVRDGVGAEAVAGLLDAHRDNRESTRCLKRKFGTLVTRIDVASSPLGKLVPSGDVVVKEVAVPWRRRLVHRLGGTSRFRDDFKKCGELTRLGVNTPAVLACSLRPAGKREFELTGFVDSALPLRELVWLGELALGAAAERRALLRAAGGWIRRLHELGVWQRDLKPENILVRRWNTSAAEFYLLDTTAVRFFHAPLEVSRRVRNLAQVVDLPRALEEEGEEVLAGYLGVPASLAGAGDAGDAGDDWMARVRPAVEARRKRRQQVSGFRYVDEEHFGTRD